MLVNTYYLLELPATVVGVGFGLSFVAAAIDRLGFVSGWDWAIAGGDRYFVSVVASQHDCSFFQPFT